MRIEVVGEPFFEFAMALVAGIGDGLEEVAGPIRVGIWRTPADAARADFVKMAVGPAHGRLDGQVQPIEPDVEWHLDAAPDHGLDVVESDLEPGDGGDTHAATLRRSIS